MAGFNRPEGGWNFVFDGLNTVDAPDAIQPTYYPYARNIRGVSDRAIRTRPGYTLFSTTPSLTTTCPLPTGQEDVAYSDTLTATGGIPPYTYTVVTGALPTGLTLHSATGVIDGTPTASGLFSFTLLVTDAAGGSNALSCTLYICPASGGGEDWIGCLAGSFTNPSDWATASSVSVSGGQGVVTGTGYARNVSGGCGSGLNQEVYAIYNTKVTSAGNHGYRRAGVATRMGGTNFSNMNGYVFTATMWGGTINNTCGYSGGAITLAINKLSGGTLSTLASTTIGGPDLTSGIPMQLTTTVEGAGARNVAVIGGTEVLNVLDSSSVLSAGLVGIACVETCGGVPPSSVSFSFIKARNL